jgi:aminoglycoside 6'-N-acetyltransferase
VVQDLIREDDLAIRALQDNVSDYEIMYLFREKGARKVSVDHRVVNARAIQCYENCGFRKVKLLPLHELHEGAPRDCWLMEVTSECDLPAALQ